MRYGGAFDRHLSSLRDSDGSPRDAIEAYQDRKLAELVAIAYERTGYYRTLMDRRGLTPASITSTGDLGALPLLRKEDIRSHRDELITRGSVPRKLLTIQTSGSTGPPMKILTPPDGLAFKWAVWWRHRERFGFTRGTPFASVMSTPWVRSGAPRSPYWRWNRVESQAFIPMQQITPGKIADIVAFLQAERFRYWAGYPSILHSLASTAEDAGLSLADGPGTVFTGAEALFDHQREGIGRFTGGNVSQMYGFNEAAGNASECEAGRLHEDFEFGYLEPVDPVTNPDGTVTGAIAATGFGNHAMPLIRYEVGDVGTWMPDGFRCPCGRESRVLARVDGRLEDYVLTPEGGRARRIGDIFKNMPDLRRFQVVQAERDRVLIRLVVGDGFLPEDEAVIRKRVALWISPSLEVAFEYPDRIDPGPSGKLQRVIGLMSDER